MSENPTPENLLAQKRIQLKTARRDAKRATLEGRHSWGDYYRTQHIKNLEKEIRNLQANKRTGI